MKFVRCLTVVFSLALLANAPSVQARPAVRDVVLPQAKRVDFKSKINQRAYRIFISTPESPAPEAGYPVIYMIDGNAMFNTALDIARAQQRPFGPAVIVGIGYPTNNLYDSARRSYDFLGKMANNEAAPGRARIETGGRDEFLQIIETEIKPLVQGRHKIDRNRQALFGHSFGGSFTLYTLFTHPEAFQTYIAASPSIWWNNGDLLNYEKEFVKAYDANKTPVRLSFLIGDLEQRPASERPERADARPSRPGMIDAAREMSGRLGALDGIQIAFNTFPEEDHMSVLPVALNRALRFAFTDGKVWPVPTGRSGQQRSRNSR